MLTIFCGDDTSTSRKKFIDLRENYDKKSYDVVTMSGDDIANFTFELLSSSTLFTNQRVYFFENALSKKALRDKLKKLLDDPQLSEAEIVMWEEASDERIVKRAFPKAKIIISKLPDTLWKLLDGLYPGNLQQSIITLRAIEDTNDIHVVHYMMMRRTKELLICAYGGQPQKLASWQIGKLKQQLRTWKPVQLENFFKKLVEIEMHTKSGTMVYSLDRALEITLSFYL